MDTISVGVTLSHCICFDYFDCLHTKFNMARYKIREILEVSIEKANILLKKSHLYIYHN